MVRALLVRGMLAGLAAGFLAFVFAFAVGEPAIDRAIALEETHSAASGDSHAGAHHEAELVSRTAQSTVGLAVGTGLYGVAVGGIFALVCATALGRIGRLSARGASAMLAAAGFVSIALVPYLKYPPNPPGIGDGETIERRSVLYLAILISSVALMALAVHLRGRLVGRLGGWNATVAAGAGYAVAMLLVSLALPPISEVPGDFPAALLWQFRVASLGTQVVLWTALGLVFGALAATVTGEREERADAGTVRTPVTPGV